MINSARIEQISKALETEEKKISDQIVHLNGQLIYNQRIQEVIRQLLSESNTPDVPDVPDTPGVEEILKAKGTANTEGSKPKSKKSKSTKTRK